jgi:aminoglycoside phosphotransferase (APT) family kinase protein
MTPDVIGLLEPRLHDELGFRVASSSQLHGGNNLLVVLVGEDGRRLVTRSPPHDARHADRLGREFRALAYLRSGGVCDVPDPLLRCDEHRVGVYSFEKGERRLADELTEHDAEHLAAFLHRLA